MIVLWHRHTRWQIWRKNMARPFLSLAHNKKNSSPPGARVATPTPDGRTTPGGPTGGDISFWNRINARAGNGAGRGSKNPCRSCSYSIRAWKIFSHWGREKSLGTQMFNLHRWYLRMSNDEGKMFGVKYRDHDFNLHRWYLRMISKIYITFTIDKPSTPLSSPFGFCKYHLPLH